MNSFEFEELPPLKTFDGLKRGDKIYTKSFGVGEVVRLYDRGQIIVGFHSCRKRFSPVDCEVWKVPSAMLEKRLGRPLASINGKAMTMKQYKRNKRIERETRLLDSEAEQLGIKITRREG